jgi:hypothetical protein
MANNLVVEQCFKNIKKYVVDIIENSDTLSDAFNLIEKSNKQLSDTISNLQGKNAELISEKTALEKTIEDNKLMVEMYNKRSRELDEKLKTFEQSNQQMERERTELKNQIDEIKERETKLIEERRKIDSDLEHINNERKVSIVSNFSKQLDDKNKYIMVLEKRIENYKRQLGLSPSFDHDTKSVKTTDMIEEPIELVVEPVEKPKAQIEEPTIETTVEPTIENTVEEQVEEEQEVIEIEMDDKVYYAIEGNPTIVYLKNEDESMGERVGVLTEEGEFIEDPKPETKKEKKSKKKNQ